MSVLADHLQRLPHSPTAARTVAAALAALLLVLLARLLLLLLGEAQLPAATMAPTAAAANAPASRQPIADWHLFGLPGNAATPASETRLSLQLRGTIAASDPAQGSAFIADANGREARYRVNDTLPGGARLLAVYPGRVLLDNAGARETLSLRGTTTGGGRTSGNTAASAAPDGGFLTGPMQFGSPDLQTQRAQRAPDIERLAEQANVLPVLENGRMIGVQVAADPALLERVGLERDDIVLAVNGINLDDPQVVAALQNQLRAGGLITLTVRRGGRDLTLSLGL
ncbi:MAG TPA: type II secretion system protein N [Arenimonas sp.]|nr:type II secretion system protein N [Arenimonas sp.]